MKVELNEEEIQCLLDVLTEAGRGDMANVCYSILEDAQGVLAEAEELAENCKHEYDYELSENQLRFVQDALMADHEVDFTYSGRGMYGRQCPCVRLERGETFDSEAETSMDSMGLGTVVYASR